MPSKPKAAKPVLPTIPKESLDQFANGPMSAEAIQAASMAGATTWAYELGAEMPAQTINQRNGTCGKTVLTEEGPRQLDIPRDRDGPLRFFQACPTHGWYGKRLSSDERPD